MAREDLVGRLLERMSDAFVCLDRDWRYTYVNNRAGEIFGRDPAALIGKHIWTEFPEGIGQPFHRAYERALAEGTPIQIEEYYPPYDKWFENRIHPGPEGLLIFFNDVTERHLEHEKHRKEVAAREQAERIAHLGFWQWELASGTVSWSDELYRIYGFEPRSRPIDFGFFLSRLHPDDRDRVKDEIGAAVHRAGTFAHHERIVRPDGSIRDLDTVGEATLDDQGRVTGLIGTCLDVTESRRQQARLRMLNEMVTGERRALEMLAAGSPTGAILTDLVRLIEELSPGSIGSVLLLDPTGTRVHPAAGPSLPAAYDRAIDGLAIGPKAGSCGTAAFRRAPVIVADIETDPLWEDYRDLIRPHGLRACWSYPILANDGRVLGTFAVYYREVREPDDEARQLIERASHVAGIVLERRRLDDQLRALSDRTEEIREDERTGIAREIHDQLGQALTALKMDIAWVARRLGDPDAAQKKLAEMSRSADEVIASVRRISAELRPGILDDLGLQAAIEWQAEDFTERTGIPTEVRSKLGDVRLDRGMSTAVFRIFQEALTNIARHSGATRVEIDLGLEKGRLRFEVADDGIGLPAGPAPGGSLGLLGMRERARRLGGECEICGREPRGTLVSLRIPLRFPAERRTDADSEIGP
jgi:PAS domain S-box-containing protein